MSSVRIEMFAYAKINLALAVVGQREDQYHELESVMQSIELHDVVRVERKGSGLVCRCGELSGPQNLAYKAAKIFLDNLGKPESVEIVIEKNIPLEAGLAGGSSDAAAVLRALNHMFAQPFTLLKLRQMALQCGADVPFCLTGGTMWATGIGEVLQALPQAPPLPVVLVKPQPGVSTGEVFRRIAKSHSYSRLRREDWEWALKRGNAEGIAGLLANGLEKIAQELVPQISSLKASLLRSGCLGALMSGSGSSVFGIARDSRQAAEIARELRRDDSLQVWVTRFKGEDPVNH